MIPTVRSRGRRVNYRRQYIISGILFVALFFLVATRLRQPKALEELQEQAMGLAHNRWIPSHAKNSLKWSNGKPGTLVIYVFSNSDKEYENNLNFFVKHGINADDGCEYVFIIQTGDGLKKTSRLPDLPPNARYEYHPNSCYDWGTIGWLIETGRVDPTQYKYFIFMNSSVRGPYIPPYMKDRVRWQEVLVGRLTEVVKLAGPTISCEGSPKDGDVNGEWRTNPHVQSYVLATDQIGLKVLLDEGNVFKCYTSMWDTIFYSELGSSYVMLKAGYSLDSFMMRYQGVDWQDKKNWECNARINPYGEYYYDGISLNPFEVMFVKMKGMLMQNEWSYAMYAKKYDTWMEASRSEAPDIVTNIWSTETKKLKGPKIAYMRHRGGTCFDQEYYRRSSKDLKTITDPKQLWEHFVTMGQFEGRPFRFTCDMQG